MLHFLLEIIIMTRSTKTRFMLQDKCKVVHSDGLYRPEVHKQDSVIYPVDRLFKMANNPVLRGGYRLSKNIYLYIE